MFENWAIHPDSLVGCGVFITDLETSINEKLLVMNVNNVLIF